jgi:dCMP deaminase
MIESIDNHLNGYLDERKEFAGLSKSLQEKLKSWDQQKKAIERPHWKYYLMGMAYLASIRSPDGRTKNGCVLVDQNKSILATGYNGPIRGIDDRILPNLKEAKYPFFQHSEMNCLLNCARQGIKTQNCVCYITGMPCFACTQALYQAGISTVYYGNKYIHMLDNQDYKDNMELFEWLTGKSMPMIHIDFDESKLKELVEC